MDYYLTMCACIASITYQTEFDNVATTYWRKLKYIQLYNEPLNGEEMYMNKM